MATTSNELDSPKKNTDNEENDGKDDPNMMFECSICLEKPTNPVVSVCGHLFCWPCLYQWLETQRGPKVCPVCKSGIDKDKVIPIYGCGNSKQEDPRNNVPPRPVDQSTVPDATDSIDPLSFGIRAFPFRFLTSFIFTDPPQEFPVGSPLALQQVDQDLSILFLWILTNILILGLSLA